MMNKNGSGEGSALNDDVEILDAAPQTSEPFSLSLEEVAASFNSLDKLAEGIADTAMCMYLRRAKKRMLLHMRKGK